MIFLDHAKENIVTHKIADVFVDIVHQATSSEEKPTRFCIELNGTASQFFQFSEKVEKWTYEVFIW